MPIDPEHLKSLMTRIVTRLKEVEVEQRAYKATLEVAHGHHPADNLPQVLVLS